MKPKRWMDIVEAVIKVLRILRNLIDELKGDDDPEPAGEQ